MTYKIDRQARCAVIGYGSWATALVKILLENESAVGWYIRNNEVLEHIRQHKTNPRYLRDVHFYTNNLKLSDDINTVVSEADVLILAVPSVYLKTTLEPLTVSLQDKFVISAIKGIVPEDYVTVTEYVNPAATASRSTTGHHQRTVPRRRGGPRAALLPDRGLQRDGKFALPR